MSEGVNDLHWRPPEIQRCGGLHGVAVGGHGARGLPGDAAAAVRHHDRGPCALPQEVPAGKVRVPGGAGVRDPLLDVLHPARGHRKVRGRTFIHSFIHSFIRSFMHLCIRSFIHSLVCSSIN